jgi:leucyl aminopeptidase
MGGEVKHMDVYFLRKGWSFCKQEIKDEKIMKLLKQKKFDAEYGDKTIFPLHNVLVIGIGNNKKGKNKITQMTPQKIKLLGAVAGNITKSIKEQNIKFHIKNVCKKQDNKQECYVWERELTFGALFAVSKFNLKTDDKDKFKLTKIKFDTQGKGMEEGQLLARAVNMCREIVDMPSNLKTPVKLTKIIIGLFEQNRTKIKTKIKTKVKVEVLNTEKIRKLGMNGVLAVAQGSRNEPRIVIAEHGRQYKNKGTYALVGKGVTFDSGGISIKPSKNMHEMKSDMAGAAAAVCAVKALSSLGVKKHVVAVAGLVENMPSGSAQRPGDIIKMYNNKTIEVLNTDAEGRLVLCDLLAYTEKRFKPKLIVDFATLTGSMVRALGHRCAGVFGNDKHLISKIIDAGENSGDRCWSMPLWDDYRENIESSLADYSNISSPASAAGSITAAMLLKQFVKAVPWAHIDIAGTAYYEQKKPCPHFGATGFGVRLAYTLLSQAI